MQSNNDAPIIKSNGKFYIQGDNGYFYPLHERSQEKYQIEKIPTSLKFTRDGLDNLRMKYKTVSGGIPIIQDFLQCKQSCKNVKNMIKHPDSYAYFQGERFLLLPNLKYYQNNKYDHSSLRKTTDPIVLCLWFVHPNQESINPELLNELKPEYNGEKTFIKSLKDKQISKPKEEYPIASQFEESGHEYLSSILDLNEQHILMLQSLKHNVFSYLKKSYGINAKDDQVLMYFHFPYEEKHATLHLHLRIGCAMHPLDETRSFLLDEIITGLQSGKTIQEIITSRQRYAINYDADFFKNIKGVFMEEGIENTYRIHGSQLNKKIPSFETETNLEKFTKKRSLKKAYSKFHQASKNLFSQLQEIKNALGDKINDFHSISENFFQEIQYLKLYSHEGYNSKERTFSYDKPLTKLTQSISCLDLNSEKIIRA